MESRLESEMFELLTFTVVITCTNVLLHSLGCFLLLKKRIDDTQELLILNLSASEILKNLVNLVTSVYNLLRINNVVIPVIITDILRYVALIYYSGISLVFVLFMIYITSDRLVRTILGGVYYLYVTEKKARNVIKATWIVALLVSIGVCVSYHYAPFGETPFLYAYASGNCIHLLLAILGYTVIFIKLRESRRRRIRISSDVTTARRNESTYYMGPDMFRRSRFYVCILLITSCLILTTIPTLVQLTLHIHYDNHVPLIYGEIIYTSYSLSDTADACIYILLRKSLRKRLFRLCMWS